MPVSDQCLNCSVFLGRIDDGVFFVVLPVEKGIPKTVQALTESVEKEHRLSLSLPKPSCTLLRRVWWVVTSRVGFLAQAADEICDSCLGWITFMIRRKSTRQVRGTSRLGLPRLLKMHLCLVFPT